MTQRYDQIYKIDTNGNVRVWYMERDAHKYRTVAGILNGSLVTADWTVCVGKQGRSDVEQAEFEVQAAYKHKLTREYHETIEGARGPAKFFKPMLAKKFEGWTGPGYAQAKLDGIRCITTADGMFSREGKPIFGAPHVHAALADKFAEDPSLIFDGELYNHELKDDFNKIVSLVKKQTPTREELAESAKLVQYHVYDLPSHSGSFGERSAAIKAIFDNVTASDIVHPVVTIKVDDSERLDNFYGMLLEAGFEGQMFRTDEPYQQKRSKTLLKRKEFETEEFECVAIEEGVGNWSGVAKRAICRLPDGRTFGAGIKGSKETAAKLLHETHKVVTVQFFGYTPDGIPRFPVAVQFHGEKREL